MSVFVELKQDIELSEETARYRTILIVACTKCPNVSLAYETGCPLASRDFTGGVTAWKPYAITDAVSKVGALLQSLEKNVVVEFEESCLLTDEKQEYMSIQRTDINAILSLTCAAGKIGIQKTVGDSVPVISGMLTTGLLQYYVDIMPTQLFVNRVKSTLIYFHGPLPDSADLQPYWDHLNRE